MPLSDAACRTAKPTDKTRKVSDAGGLYLQIEPRGSKLWRMNYRFANKQKTLAFGRYPEVSLAQARAKRDDAKAQLAAGLDPADPRPALLSTFEEVATEWLESRTSWTGAYLRRVVSRMEADIFPHIGHLAIGTIDAPTILTTLRKIEERGAHEIAKRLLQNVGQIMRYAIATGRADRNPAADLKGALLPSPRIRHMSALQDKDLPEFFKKLELYDGHRRTRLAIEFIMHTFVRTNELRFARWVEFEEQTWRIPSERMKMRREHIVPLTKSSKLLLEKLREEADSTEFVCSMSENTMLFALYRMGYHSKATIHGFRSTASTILNESGLWSPDAIERQLAHVPENTVRAAYNAAQYLQERRRMMEWWSEYLDNKKSAQ